MRSIGYRNVQMKGDLCARNVKNYARMHDRLYRPGVVGTKEAENVGWPGDWEGRTILALTLLAQSIDSEPAYLEEIVEEILDNCNAGGYRGDLLVPDAINEQQMAGHGWLLRGLVEYYRWKGDGRVRSSIQQIVNNLYLPLAGHFANYPVRQEEREFHQGEAAGSLADKVNEWLLSTDIGCVFISLDGLSQAYEELRDPALGQLLEEMMGVFFTIDFTGITAQTHASLTGMRGVVRMYEVTGQASLLEQALSFFKLYKSEGMTENYANFNLFRTPSWTEPCGIIDSYMLALSLWEHTGNEELLEEAHAIWHNGVERGQRPNGGFGCDTTVEDGHVAIHKNYYEAYWCCTMRGGEGLGVPMRKALFETDDRLQLPLYVDGIYKREQGGREELRVASSYPCEGRIELSVMQGSGSLVHIAMFVPSWALNVKVEKNGAAIPFRLEAGFANFEGELLTGTAFTLTFDIPLMAVPTQGNLYAGSDLHTLRHGLLVLGAARRYEERVNPSALAYAGQGRYTGPDLDLLPLGGAYLLDEATLREQSYQVLFRVGQADD
ncbi:glycoside hydrolase family protein [Cohnella fermenti]|uniref:Glycosyl hydrolase n=1 Tax=Cohnella fermenti TaxID=2565925 RepID=A0A4S4BRZ8_9BACL|nr:beta-L-arabinofuranosidase domain-containing protein [Cohnella fermenti]THF77791.1 hypothetical protein E6C55_15755 [Cohnella fermenti]